MKIDATGSVPAGQTAALIGRPDAKLVAAAHEFEAMMLEQMLKPLKFGAVGVATGDEDDGDDTKGGGSSDTIREFGVEAVGKAIASGGGLGLARQIIRQVSAEQKAQHLANPNEL